MTLALRTMCDLAREILLGPVGLSFQARVSKAALTSIETPLQRNGFVTWALYIPLSSAYSPATIVHGCIAVKKTTIYIPSKTKYLPISLTKTTLTHVIWGNKAPSCCDLILTSSLHSQGQIYRSIAEKDNNVCVKSKKINAKLGKNVRKIDQIGQGLFYPFQLL